MQSKHKAIVIQSLLVLAVSSAASAAEAVDGTPTFPTICDDAFTTTTDCGRGGLQDLLFNAEADPLMLENEDATSTAVADFAAPQRRCHQYNKVISTVDSCHEVAVLVCATCGDGICEAAEVCTSSHCGCWGQRTVCTDDCGGLYCSQDCK